MFLDVCPLDPGDPFKNHFGQNIIRFTSSRHHPRQHCQTLDTDPATSQAPADVEEIGVLFRIIFPATCLPSSNWPITHCFLRLASSRLQLSWVAVCLNYSHAAVSQRVDKHVISQIRNPFATSCKHFPHRRKKVLRARREQTESFFCCCCCCFSFFQHVTLESTLQNKTTHTHTL